MPTEHGRLIARGDALPGFFIEGGFSGAPILDSQSAVVLGMAALAVRDKERRTAFVLPASDLEQAWPLLARPYKGLSAFRENDARFFKGRDRYVSELAEKVAAYPVVTVIGPSGSGKSSLVRAGLMPLLRSQDDWRIITFRPAAPSADPFVNLVTALDDWQDQGPLLSAIAHQNQNVRILADQLRQNPAEFAALLRRLQEKDGRPILLLVDQFEELFTTVADPAEHDPEQSVRSRFVRCLAGASNTQRGRPAARCVFTIRADYMGHALKSPDLANLLRETDLKLGPMTLHELREAITLPAKALDVTFDEDLVSELLAAVATVPDALPLLEFTLAELWGRQENRVIKGTRQQPDADGRRLLLEPLIRHADLVYTELSREFGEAVFRKVMVGLVWIADPSQPGNDTRRVRRKSWFSASEWALVEQLAAQDREARLVTVRAQDDDADPTVDIVHEVLIWQWPLLQRWLSEDRAFRLWLQAAERDAAAARRDHGFNPDFLYKGGRLEEALRWQKERAADDLRSVAEFISAAEELRDEEARDRKAQEDRELQLAADKAAAEQRLREEAEQRAKSERVAAEAARQLAERERIAAEAAKQSAESERKAAKSARFRSWIAIALGTSAILAALFAGSQMIKADRQRSEAERQTIAANEQRNLAEQARQVADDQRQIAEREAKIAARTRAMMLVGMSTKETEAGRPERGLLLALEAKPADAGPISLSDFLQ